jgi:hypothetical protein
MIALLILAGVAAIVFLAVILAGAWYVGYLLQLADEEKARTQHTRIDVTTVPAGALERMRQHPGPSPEFRAAVERAAERKRR